MTEPDWEVRLMPNPIRAAALANAVELVKEASFYSVDQQELDRATDGILAIAARFEAYLTEQEADGTI